MVTLQKIPGSIALSCVFTFAVFTFFIFIFVFFFVLGILFFLLRITFNSRVFFDICVRPSKTFLYESVLFNFNSYSLFEGFDEWLRLIEEGGLEKRYGSFFEDLNTATVGDFPTSLFFPFESDFEEKELLALLFTLLLSSH